MIFVYRIAVALTDILVYEIRIINLFFNIFYTAVQCKL